MKKLLLVVTLAFASLTQAQIDASLNPLGALFGRPEVAGEYLLSDNMGVELALSTAFGKTGASINGSERPTQSGFGVKLMGKYYFSPDQGGDGWYGALYLRQESSTISYGADFNDYDYTSNILAAGVQFGKKWVFDSGLLIEGGFGIGRPFVEKRGWVNSDSDYDATFSIGMDFTARFAVGYRFGN